MQNMQEIGAITRHLTYTSALVLLYNYTKAQVIYSNMCEYNFIYW